jgi:predicted small secreted protein
MKRYLYLIIAAAAIAVLASCCKNSGYGYEIKDGVAVYNTPDVLQTRSR